MNWNIRTVTEPAVEPVTLDELKLQAHITHTVQDSTLTAYIKAARTQAEEYIRMSFINRTIELSLDSFPAGEVLLLKGPVSAVTSVKVFDENNVETSIALTEFDINLSAVPAKICLKSGGSWPSITPRRYNAVQIRYTAGFGAAGSNVPADIKHAITLFASFADDNRAAEIAEYPAAFWDLLRPGRVANYAPV